jgi:hypothetical protein
LALLREVLLFTGFSAVGSLVIFFVGNWLLKLFFVNYFLNYAQSFAILGVLFILRLIYMRFIAYETCIENDKLKEELRDKSESLMRAGVVMHALAKAHGGKLTIYDHDFKRINLEEEYIEYVQEENAQSFVIKRWEDK